MSDAAFTLRKAPIIEAVVDIECDFRAGQELAALEAPAKKRFSDEYPQFQVQLHHQLKFEVTDGKPMSSSSRQGVQALQFLKSDGKQLVQLRDSGFSFNRLAPYTSFDEYLPQIRRSWDLYREVADPIQIKSVRLRYINRILLPVTDNVAQLEDYFRLGPRPADEDDLKFVSFLTQYVAVDSATGHHVTTLLTTQRSEEDGIPVIFDNGASASLSADPEDWNRLGETLGALRALKNRVFRNTLRDKCLSLFQ